MPSLNTLHIVYRMLKADLNLEKCGVLYFVFATVSGWNNGGVVSVYNIYIYILLILEKMGGGEV